MPSEQSRVRDERIAALEGDAAQWAEKLAAQDARQTRPGKKLSDAATTARFYKAVADAHLVLIIKANLASEIAARCKALADIEREFRVLKSEIEIAPVFSRLPDRIRAHVLICFLALRLYRVLRLRLKAKARPI